MTYITSDIPVARAFYNEIDRFAAGWLRELIRDGLIADGDVDERDIRNIRPDELRGYTQCHFFAGIGGWSYALRLAGWPDDRPVWTGSCPCQPFSAAGTRAGFADERHLWPYFFHLIQNGKGRGVPLFGEQVASKDGLAWLDLVSSDLEGEGYAVWAVDMCGAGFGSPDIRQRLWFVAFPRCESEGRGLSDTREGVGKVTKRAPDQSGGSNGACGLGNPDLTRPQGRGVSGADRGRDGTGECVAGPSRLDGHHDRERSFWYDCEWIPCIDGKTRPVEPGTFPLAHGVPARVGRLRGYGNAIKPLVAAEFVKAYVEIAEGR